MAPILLALANLAPLLTKYIGGSDSTVGKVVTAASEIATTIAGAPTVEEAIVKISSDPEKLAQFRLQVTQQSIEWDKIFLADIQSARDRDVKLRQAGYANSRASWMLLSAYAGVVMCFFGIWSTDLDDFQKSVLTLVLGRMLGYIDQGFNFEFGTTRNSKAKDDTISKLSGGS